MNDIYDLRSIFPDSIDKLHHAFCFEGQKQNILISLRKFLEDDLKFGTIGNPDFYHGDFDTLGIDEGRMIKEMQNNKAIVFSRRIFIITANSITKEAQNSLLKMFEEPSGSAVFFLLIPSASILLPTLRSRLMLINTHRESNKNNESDKTRDSFDAKKFIKSSISERLAEVKKISDEIADEKISKSIILDYLNGIESELLSSLDKKNMKKNDLFILGEIDKCRSYASDRSPSVKILMEHIAIIL